MLMYYRTVCRAKTSDVTGHFPTHFSIWLNKVQFSRPNQLYIFNGGDSLTICSDQLATFKYLFELAFQY